MPQDSRLQDGGLQDGGLQDGGLQDGGLLPVQPADGKKFSQETKAKKLPQTGIHTCKRKFYTALKYYH